MYKLTVMDSFESIYDSVFNPLPEGEVYFHTHQMLWKDNIQIGRIFIGKNFARLILGTNTPINIPRDKFQELFMKDAPIVEMIFNAIEISRVKMFNKNGYRLASHGKHKLARLYQSTGNKFNFYADLIYDLK